MDYVYRASVAPQINYDCIGAASLGLKEKDTVVVDCDRYQDVAVIDDCNDGDELDAEGLEKLTFCASHGRHIEGHQIPRILRLLTAEDKLKAEENKRDAQAMQVTAMERVAAHKLDMKLVHVHYSFDRKVIIFQFAAEGRIDFRELLRDLSHRFRTRVELRQVGVRDETAMHGGIGVCGRPYCCSTFLHTFRNINVKMAKMQGLSLNPVNISGGCGRLKCCLAFEMDHYRELAAEGKKRREEERKEGGRREGESEAGSSRGNDQRQRRNAGERGGQRSQTTRNQGSSRRESSANDGQISSETKRDNAGAQGSSEKTEGNSRGNSRREGGNKSQGNQRRRSSNKGQNRQRQNSENKSAESAPKPGEKGEQPAKKQGNSNRRRRPRRGNRKPNGAAPKE